MSDDAPPDPPTDQSAGEDASAPGEERESRPRLRPARPEEGGEEKEAFFSGVPWKWIALGVLVVGVVGGAYWWREQQKADQLRADVLTAYDRNVAPLGERYRRFRGKIERWTIDATKRAPQRRVDPRLKISGLHRGQGLYLRVTASEVTDVATLERAARAMESDAITRCLGVAPISTRGLWEKGDLLDPTWIRRARDASGVMKLRVIDDELARRSQRDLPVIANMLRSDWFLLVVQRGVNRRDHPVDVFLWDLRRDQQLLAARIQARGLLVPAGIQVEGVPRGPRAPVRQTGGAQDCSIAAQITGLTGEAPVEFDSELPAPPPDAGPRADAGRAADAGARGRDAGTAAAPP